MSEHDHADNVDIQALLLELHSLRKQNSDMRQVQEGALAQSVNVWTPAMTQEVAINQAKRMEDKLHKCINAN